MQTKNSHTYIHAVYDRLLYLGCFSPSFVRLRVKASDKCKISPAVQQACYYMDCMICCYSMQGYTLCQPHYLHHHKLELYHHVNLVIQSCK